MSVQSPTKRDVLDAKGIVEQLQVRFTELSPRLRDAARYVIDNPEEIALHSMRQIAQRARVSPNVMIRLARDIGCETYDEFRDHFRDNISRQGSSWLNRAEVIRGRAPSRTIDQIGHSYLGQEILNLQTTFRPECLATVEAAAQTIASAENLYIVGLRSLFPAAYYLHYSCSLFAQRSKLLTGLGGTFADELRNVGGRDVLVAFTYRPYSRDAIRAISFARSRGARIVAVTDSTVSPALAEGTLGIIVRNTSTSLFPSLIPAIAVAQLIVALLLRHGDRKTMEAIRASEEQLNSFNVYID